MSARKLEFFVRSLPTDARGKKKTFSCVFSKKTLSTQLMVMIRKFCVEWSKLKQFFMKKNTEIYGVWNPICVIYQPN